MEQGGAGATVEKGRKLYWGQLERLVQVKEQLHAPNGPQAQSRWGSKRAADEADGMGATNLWNKPERAGGTDALLDKRLAHRRRRDECGGRLT
jgi:hypothetical protein